MSIRCLKYQVRIARKCQLRLMWNADGQRCIYCRQSIVFSKMSIDHLIPRSKGGPDHPDNRVHSCLRCNNEKSDMLPLQFVLSRLHVRMKGVAG